MNPLWQHQKDGIASIIAAFDSGKRHVCYQLPTGAGKSRVLREVIAHFHDQQRVIYLVTHRKSLLKQLAAEMREGGLNFSIVAPGFPVIRTRLRICMIQSLARRAENMAEPELLIYEECHHVGAASYHKIRERWPDARSLGVSATPYRGDRQCLSFDTLITGPAMGTLIERSVLSPYLYYAPPTVTAEGLHIQRGEYITSEAEARVDNRAIIGDAIEHYRKIADHKPAIVSCVSIAHAEHVVQQFLESGYRAQAVHSRLSEELIDRYLNGLRDGTLEVLCQCELLGEGVDIKGATVLIGLRFTASITIYLQHIGRVLRYVPGKTAIIIDHVDNLSRFGLPSLEREWSLDGEEPRIKDGQLLYKRCPSCYRGDVLKTARVCFCGYEFSGLDAARSRIPEEREGELVLVSDDVGLHHVESFQEGHKKSAMSRIAKEAKTIDQAREIAEQFGYKRAFADIVWCKIMKRRRIA